MADLNRNSNGLSSDSIKISENELLPDYNREFLCEKDINAFAAVLGAPEVILVPDREDSSADESFQNKKLGNGHWSVNGISTRLAKDVPKKQKKLFMMTRKNWSLTNSTKPWSNKKKKASGKTGKPQPRTRDETREGYAYMILKWPLLFFVLVLMFFLVMTYLITRLYIWLYENYIAWRGEREKLRRILMSTTNYTDWVKAAKTLDTCLGNDQWKTEDAYAYYDHKTIRRVLEQMRRCRRRIDGTSHQKDVNPVVQPAIEELKSLISACVKNNFVGIENSRLYSETYYGTKNLVQNFIDEVERAISILAETKYLDAQEKMLLFKSIQKNYGRTALCLSGGASFAYYHFGVVKALLDAELLPGVITGTSGGALIAALVATRTNEELKKLLVPTLADKINGCSEPLSDWLPRWWKTGARFDPIDWAKKCNWFSRGSMTFREAYERTGRILNITCVPADPHSPTVLLNYLTSPDCVIWSAVLASAAVPGILNPVVLMLKNRDGNLDPYSFGHKWKDGSLRTDIPLKALNLHFNVNFSIVSQANPHVNFFFFSSRGSVGQPVTHRRGRGWRGGFLGSAMERYLKLDLNKWLRVVRALELLPRPLGQDWSEIWLQKFSGTITIWPRIITSDFWRILSDPNPKQLARMLHVGQQSAFPKIKFIANRLKVELIISRGRQATRAVLQKASLESMKSKYDARSSLRHGEGLSSEVEGTDQGCITVWEEDDDEEDDVVKEIIFEEETLLNKKDQ
ncbi:hypothetical protein Golomagni_05253 [Golovinomyces magnicellulatus]|nr:hypothetical protein Golomagni_05253 [Golovinomyces magnicellulatus]